MTKLIEMPKYTFSNGIEISLKPIPPFLLNQIVSSKKGKPVAPFVEYERLGKKYVEQNFGDEGYKRALSDFEDSRNQKLMQFMFTYAVIGSVGTYVEDEKDLREIETLTKFVYGDAYTEDELKYVWISSMLQDADEIADFQNAIQELAGVTDSSIAESKSDF